MSRLSGSAGTLLKARTAWRIQLREAVSFSLDRVFASILLVLQDVFNNFIVEPLHLRLYLMQVRQAPRLSFQELLSYGSAHTLAEQYTRQGHLIDARKDKWRVSAISAFLGATIVLGHAPTDEVIEDLNP